MKSFEKREMPDKNVYYMALSATQKCIRRSNVEGALNFAKVAWKCEPYRIWQRMWTWLFEDCCRNLEALKLFHKWRSNSNDFNAMIPLLREMASGPKDRTGPMLADIILGRAKPIAIFFALKDHPIHKKLIHLIKNWPERQFECYDIWDYKAGGENFSWVVDLAERANKSAQYGFAVGIPYLFLPDTYQASTFCVNECGSLTLYQNFYPLEALDGHTRPGKTAYGIYLKHKSSIAFDSNELFNYHFYNETWLLRDYSPYAFDFVSLVMKYGQWGKYYGAEIKERFKPESEELLRVGAWVLDKMFKDEVTRLRTEYYKDFIK